MLKIQEYLLTPGKSLKTLKDELDINSVIHSTEPLVSLKYGPDTPKFHSLSIECRGIILELDTWEVVSKGFNRFFNYWDTDGPGHKDFFNCKFRTFEKCDGSIIYLFYYQDRWRIATSNSFAKGLTPGGRCSWEKLFWGVFPFNYNETFDYLDKLHTYVFELTSPENIVVQQHKETRITLLAQFNKNHKYIDVCSAFFKYPEEFYFNNLEEAVANLKWRNETRPDFEGFVLMNERGEFMKVKSESYLFLNHSKTQLNTKKLIEIILEEVDIHEILNFAPEHKDRSCSIKYQADLIVRKLKFVYEKETLDNPSNKDLYSRVKDDQLAPLVMELHKKPDKTIDTYRQMIYNNPKTFKVIQKIILERLKENS